MSGSIRVPGTAEAEIKEFVHERDGQPLEKIAKQFIQAKFVRPKVRPYQTNNYYAVLIRQAQAEMEVNHIVYGEKSVPKNRKKKPE